MPHATKNRFTLADLERLGFVQNSAGEWEKPDDLARLQKPIAKHNPQRSAAGSNENKKRSPGSVEKKPHVCIYGFKRSLQDDDNFRGGLKYLRDAIAKSLKQDDAEKFIMWSYYQVKVESKQEEGTLVKIYDYV
jgi:hypothetical protein